MPDMFEIQETVTEVLLLLTCEYKQEQAVARLTQWLRDTELEIDQFETSQWEQHMEENYQMTIMERGLLKW